MNRLITLLFISTLNNISFGQIDANGNPIFNSVTLKEEVLDSCSISLNYYTLKGNIDTKKSSVFISNNPTLDQIQNAAINLPSDFYVLSKNQSLICMIMILNSPQRGFLVVNPQTGEQKEYKCKLKGDISENRAKEIIENKYDNKSNISNEILFFNGKKLKIYTNNDAKSAVFNLIKSEKFDKIKATNIKTLTQEETKEIILKETKQGGKFDFFTPIKGKEYDGIQIKPGVFSTKIGIALYNWGKATYEIGLNKLEDAYSIFSEFKGRQLNEREKEYIKLGFNRELEK
ncbi:MAG: hypothetical protein JNL70_10780 [Saprospiraceae bacterium]|nr:hypothetical protein [Saprospiraceae bacterium]